MNGLLKQGLAGAIGEFVAVVEVEREFDGKSPRNQMVVPVSYQESQMVSVSCFLLHAMFQAIRDLHDGSLVSVHGHSSAVTE